MKVVIIILFFFSLFLKLPIGIWLGIGGLIFTSIRGISPLIIVQKFTEGIDSFVLLAVPLFTLAGSLMNETGITNSLINFCMKLFGNFRGGLAYVSIAANTIMAGVSGSASADVAVLGTIMLPAMEKQGYDKAYASAVLASGSIIGPTIPPSIILVIMGVVGNLSIGGLFSAGIIPGLIFFFVLIGLASYYAVKDKHPKLDVKTTMRQRLKSFIDALPALIMPIIILGGIRLGIVTPTEGAAVAVLYALLYGLFTRTLSIKKIIASLENATMVTGTILLIVGMANLIAYMLSIQGVPDFIAHWVNSHNFGFYSYMLLTVGFLTLVGCLLEGIAAIYIFAPLLIRGALVLGIDPLFYGFIISITLIVGMITPPMGVCLFVICSIGKISMKDLIQKIFPFIVIIFISLIMMSMSPGLILWLPRVLGFI